MCTRVGTRPCPVCRSLGWRPPQRGKRRPRPPTHGQLPSLLLKPKNLKKSGPGFIGGRVERAGPKRSRRSAAVTIRRRHVSAPILGSFSHILRQVHQETCHSPFKDGPGRRHARRSPLRPGHRGRALPADPDPPPPLPPEERPEGRPRLQAASPASSAPPQRDGKLLRPTGSRGARAPASPAALPVPCCPVFSRPSARVAASRTCHTGSRLAVPSKDSLRRRTPRSDACSVTSSSSGFARMSRSGPTSSTHRNRAGIRVTGGSGAMFFQN